MCGIRMCSRFCVPDTKCDNIPDDIIYVFLIFLIRGVKSYLLKIDNSLTNYIGSSLVFKDGIFNLI